MCPSIVILSGESGSGKTTVCSRLARAAQDAGLSVGGLLTLDDKQGDRRMSLIVQDLRSGDSRHLAGLQDGTRKGQELGCWVFDREGIAWGQAALRAAVPCDVLIVDEIGPLEMTCGDGWVDAFDLVRSGLFRLAVLVARPALVTKVHQVLSPARALVLNVDRSNREGLPVRLLNLALGTDGAVGSTYTESTMEST